jgi:hypothetical protein
VQAQYLQLVRLRLSRKRHQLVQLLMRKQRLPLVQTPTLKNL